MLVKFATKVKNSNKAEVDKTIYKVDETIYSLQHAFFPPLELYQDLSLT